MKDKINLIIGTLAVAGVLTGCSWYTLDSLEGDSGATTESPQSEEVEGWESNSSLLTSQALAELESAKTEGTSEQRDLEEQYLNNFAKNADTVGYVYCKELGIDYPVVQGRDNKEYLRTSFDGEPDLAGTIFLDSRCNLELCPWLKMLHGHNMKDGTMFANVPRLLSLKTTSQAPHIYFYSPETGLGEWEVVSVMSVSSKEEALPIDILYSYEDLENLTEELISRSAVEADVVPETSNLLILNTCWYGETGKEHNLHCLVVAAKT